MIERPQPVMIRFLDRDCEGDIVTVEFKTPTGSVEVMAEVHLVGHTAYAVGFISIATIGTRMRSVGYS